MFRSIRAPLRGFALLVTTACAGAPVRGPLPADAGPAEVRASSLQEQCRRSRNQMNCYSEALLQVLRTEGVGEAMETLEHLAARDQGVEREGHMYAHAIGLAASPSPERVDETFRGCRPSFQSGCYHGVIQSYFTSLVEGGEEVDADATNALCADYRQNDEDRWLLFQCVHGMGHGLAMLHDYHLPSALEGCDLLARDWDREGCYGGVFMENIVNATMPHHAMGRPEVARAEGTAMDAHAGHHGAASVQTPAPAGHAGGGHGEHPDGETAADAPDAHAGHAAHAAPAPASGAHDHGAAAAAPAVPEAFPPLDRNRPLYPCSVLQERYLNACYMMQTSAILYYNGGDLEATAAACDQAPQRHRAACYISLGRDVSAITLQDHEKARAACSVGDPAYNVWCHIGYVKNLIDLTADPADALSYCRDVEGANLEQACYHAVGEEIWVLTSDRAQAEAWCASAEEGQAEHCRRGAGLVSWRDVGAE